jgi:hypothetical protein
VPNCERSVRVPAAIVAFVIIRERRKQGTSRIPLSQIAQNVRQEVDEFVDSIVSVAGLFYGSSSS